MPEQEIKKLYEKLFSNGIEGIGFNFLKSTFQEKPSKKLKGGKTPRPWKKIYFKTYPRFLQIELSTEHSKKGGRQEDKLFSIFKKRKSERKFSGKCLDLKIINQLLYYSSGIKDFNKAKKDFDKARRAYPSAGARYPLEIYSVVLRSKEIPLGIYHYNVKWNTLELLLKGDFKKEFRRKITNQAWVEKSGVIIIITAVFGRTLIKYKERGWRYILIEAGHLAQNIYLISTLLRLKCCAIGGFVDKKVIELLDLNPKNELPLYLIVIGT